MPPKLKMTGEDTLASKGPTTPLAPYYKEEFGHNLPRLPSCRRVIGGD